MARIHSLACVDPAATIADDAEIGPFCVVGPAVTLEAGSRLVAHVQVTGHTRIGARTVVQAFSSLGTAPQSKSYRGEPTRLEIGADCDIRENVTMNTGTVAGGGLTRVGDRGMYMAYAHVGHDSHVGDDVIFANCATLGGHCIVGDRVFLGGLSAVHQHGRIGTGALVGGGSGLNADLIPFGSVLGVPADLRGLNVLGMKRRGLSREAIATVSRAYRELFHGSGNFADRLDRVAESHGTEPVVAMIVDFVRADRTRRLCHPRRVAD